MIDKYENLFCSFSGGQTSAYMALWVRDNYPDKNIKYCFANTGQEHHETYEFIKNCQDVFGLDVTWIEPVIPKVGDCGFKVVDYNTACRDGSLFEAMVERYGIPDVKRPFCTRELKTRPLHFYIKSMWKKSEYCTAIGIRADEVDRVNDNYEKERYWYPLAWNNITKQDVNDFWDKQPFKLGIPNHLGNCVWCYKKSYKKLGMIAAESLDYFKVPMELEKKYPIHHVEAQKSRVGTPTSIFRGKKTTLEMLEEFKRDKLSQLSLFDIDTGYDNSCKESCEPL